jgi:RnfABCDGE-type electron transport complex B subunit
MTLTTILLAAGILLLVAVVMALILGWANDAFHVEVNPLIEQAIDILPGANCGACGYVGCSEYAEAVAEGRDTINKCPVGGDAVIEALSKLLGVEAEGSWPYRPAVHCGATYDQRLGQTDYQGEPTCAAANLVAGVQGCTYGCLGMGDCVTSCAFDAIHIVDGLATVDYQKCTGCGACAKVCPRNIISMVPFKAERMIVVACSNKDFGKDVKTVCKVGCLGCKACARASDLFTVEDNLPRIDYDKYDPDQMEAVEVALEKCPMKRVAEMGKPSEKDLAALADEETPDIVQGEFKTTVDNTEWHG